MSQAISRRGSLLGSPQPITGTTRAVGNGYYLYFSGVNRELNDVIESTDHGKAKSASGVANSLLPNASGFSSILVSTESTECQNSSQDRDVANQTTVLPR